MNIQEVYEHAEKMLARKTNTMTKIKLKCWIYHSESRVKNGNEPFPFTNSLGKDFYIEYVNAGFIDCSDIGGRDKAIEAINIWFS